MVYLELPQAKTEEELMLQAKYANFRKKKQATETVVAESDRVPHVQIQSKSTSEAAQEAREKAQKLIKSGAIKPIESLKRSEGFKRSRALERKLNSTENTVFSYQPFPATQPREELTEARPNVKKMNFVPSADPADKVAEKPTEIESKENQLTKGHTIFVLSWKGLPANFLKEHFSKFGNILNIAMETPKKGFVTFEETDAAARAISQMDGTEVSTIKLQVALARFQPPIDSFKSSPSSRMWSSATANYGKRHHKDKREMKFYDDNIFN